MLLFYWAPGRAFATRSLCAPGATAPGHIKELRQIALSLARDSAPLSGKAYIKKYSNLLP